MVKALRQICIDLIVVNKIYSILFKQYWYTLNKWYTSQTLAN